MILPPTSEISHHHKVTNMTMSPTSLSSIFTVKLIFFTVKICTSDIFNSKKLTLSSCMCHTQTWNWTHYSEPVRIVTFNRVHTVTESLITWFKDCQLTHLSLIQIYYPDKATEPPLEVKKLKSKKEIEKLKRANIEVIEREPIRIVYHLLIR